MTALAKTTRPRTTMAVPRPRLFRILDRAARTKPITWVWAPPGSGKTTVVADYLSRQRRAHLWFQIDEGDQDLASFFYFLSLAAPKRKRPLPLLTPEYRQSLNIFTRDFFRQFLGRFNAPITLVFDNYQEVSADADLNQILPVALAELPDSAKAIFISRSEPPPSFASLRAKQSIEQLDWSAIKFSRAEINSLVKRHMPSRWPAKLVDQLYQTADGWAAGLILLLDQYKRDGVSSIGAASGSSQVLFDYFAGEIFKQMDGATKTLLMQTAYFDRVTPAMAEQLTGVISSGEILHRLHRQNYFTNRLTGADAVYEYHPLFREFLRLQANRSYERGQLTAIWQRAANILAAGGSIEAAVSLYDQGGDWPGIANLIRRHASNLVAQGRLPTLFEWLSRLPEATQTGDPWLLYWRAVCQHGHRFSESRRDALRAIVGFHSRKDPIGAYTAWSTAVLTVLYEARDTKHFDPWIALIEDLRREFPVFPSEAVEANVACGILVLITWRQHRHAEVDYWRRRCLALAQRNVEPVLAGQLWTTLLINSVVRGEFAEIRPILTELQKLAHDTNAPPTARAAASMGLVWSWLTGDTKIALAALKDGIDAAQAVGFGSTASGLLLTGASAALSAGDIHLAEQCLNAVEPNLHSAPTAHVLWSHANALWLHLLRGNLDLAAVKADQLVNFCTATGWAHDEAAARLVALQAWHASGQPDRAAAQAARVIELADTLASPHFEFMGLLAEARLAFDQRREEDGIKSLRKALTLGRQRGYYTSYGWLPNVIAQLCAKALDADIEVEYVRELIAKRNLVPDDAVDAETWPWPIKVLTLGGLTIFRGGAPITFGRKVQRKPLALLKAIIAFGGKQVAEEALLDLLWPDADGDAARIALKSTVHRLRKLLGHEESILREENRIGLNDRLCWVDAFTLDRLLKRAEPIDSRDEDSWRAAARLVERAAALYRGAFSDPEIAAAAVLSNGLKRRLLTQLLRLGTDAEGYEQWQTAARFYEQGINTDPTAEALCRRLMQLYHRLGRTADALGIYQNCRAALKENLGTTPSAETEAIMKRILAT